MTVHRQTKVKRGLWSHKGQFGYVLIVAGSTLYSGSPVFNAIASLRSGADLVTIVGARRAMDIAATFTPDLITYPLNGDLAPQHVNRIISLSQKFDALVIGGGLPRRAATHRAIREIIQRINLPMVIDAEAIRAVAIHPHILLGKKAVLTPHTEEFRVLTGVRVKPDVKDRTKNVKEWAKKLGTVVLLKGSVDVISDGNRVLLNRTGSPFMTKGGFGDTLAGICGTMLSQGFSPLNAAHRAAYLNGLAGERACKKYKAGVLASDLFEFLPQVL